MGWCWRFLGNSHLEILVALAVSHGISNLVKDINTVYVVYNTTAGIAKKKHQSDYWIAHTSHTSADATVRQFGATVQLFGVRAQESENLTVIGHIPHHALHLRCI